MKSFSIGAPVRWKWMGGYIEGEVVEVFNEPITIKIKGKKIKRNGSPEKPAFYVKSKAGNFALKLITELEANTDNSSKLRYQNDERWKD